MSAFSHDWKEWLEILGLLVAFCLGIPLLAYFLAVALFGQAILVGPFVLMSPFLAFGILALIHVGFEADLPAATKSAEDDLQAVFNDIGAGLGYKNLQVLVQTEDGKRHKWPLDVDENKVLVFERFWNGFHVTDRKFLAAYSLARNIGVESLINKNIYVLAFVVLGACLITTKNLWAILPIHSGALIATYLITRYVDHRRAIAADAQALRITRDYPAARRFVAWHLRHAYERWHGQFPDKRLEALRNEAISLELI